MNGVLESTWVWVLFYHLLASWHWFIYLTSLKLSIVICKTESVIMSYRIKWDIIESFPSLLLCSFKKSTGSVSGGLVDTPQYFPTEFQWCLAWVSGLFVICWSTDTLYPHAVASKTISLSWNCPVYMADLLWPFCIVDLSPLDRAYWTRGRALTYTGPIRFSHQGIGNWLKEKAVSLFPGVLTCNLGRSGQTFSTVWTK